MATLEKEFLKARRHLIKVDPNLASHIKKIGVLPFAQRHKQDPFQTLVESVAHQQLTGKAAESILKKFKNLYPNKKFPTPADIQNTPHEMLRSAGLSNAKALSIRDLALKHSEGKIPNFKNILKMENEAIITQLTEVRGIGRWTVEMLLIFNLGRFDVFPATDYGVRKGFAKAFKKRKLPHPKDLLKHSEKWRPYRSVAALYLWRVLDEE